MSSKLPPQAELDTLAEAGRKGGIAGARFAAAFNEWMRLYTENPADFAIEWQSVGEYLKEVNEGKEPSYGETCSVFFAKLLGATEAGDRIDVEQAAKSLASMTDTLAKGNE